MSRALRALVRRELRTLARSRSHLALAAAVALVLPALAWAGGGSAYVTTVLAILTPVEVVLPALVAAFVYRSVVDDRDRGELALVRTYPVRLRTYVAGVYLGRTTALLGTVLLALAVAGVVPTLRAPDGTFLSTHAGLDSPVLFARFVLLTALFVAVLAATFVALSAAARTLGRSVALAVGGAVVLVVGLDLAVVAGLATGLVPEGALSVLAVASPNGAYRSLVLGTVVAPVVTAPVRAGNPLLALLSLLSWGGGALAAATLLTDRLT